MSPETIKMLRGLGLRSQVIQRMRRWTPETERESSWLKGWKLYSAFGLGDAILTCGFRDHVLNFQSDSADEKRKEKGRLSDYADVLWLINPFAMP